MKYRAVSRSRASRRIAQPRPWATEIDPYWEPGPFISITVHEDDKVRSTGILDHRGNEIFAFPDKHPIGFNRFEE
jgi:hypothetical protein